MLLPAPLALFLLLAGPAGAATVLSVGDGDTLRVSDGAKRLTIRMACIDAPETAQRPYGAASRQRLQELAPVGSVVTLRPQTIDRYGRTVAEMFRNGQNVNLAMESSGAAYPLRGPAATPTGSIWAPAMAPPTWGLRLQRNGSGSACGLCLGGSSGRGIGARAPARLLHLLPPCFCPPCCRVGFGGRS